MSVAFVALSLLLGVACLIPATAKLAGVPRVRDAAVRFGIPWRRYQLLWIPELAAGAGVLIGLRLHLLGITAAAGMVLLLIGAVVAHRGIRDSAKDMAPALLTLAITIAYLAVAVTG